MKFQFSTGIFQLLAAGFLLLGTGCETVEKCSLTYRLWNHDEWWKFNEPAPNPNLALFQGTGSDLLVQYDSYSEKHSTVQRRAYFLEPNKIRIAAGQQPAWVKPSATRGMHLITVLREPGVITNAPELPVYAVVAKNGGEFTLHHLREPEATFALPVYPESSGTATRIVLTPFAVAGDTVMVGVGAAVLGFLMWVEGGSWGH